MGRVWQFVASPRTGLLLGGVVLGIVAAATFLYPGLLDAKGHSPRWIQVILLSLLAPLFLHLVAGAAERLLRFRVRTIGPLLLYAGGVAFLAGGGMGLRGARDGGTVRPLPEPPSFESFHDENRGTEERLPFRVVVEDFAIDWRTPHMLLYEEDLPEGKRTREVEVSVGSAFSVEGGKVSVEVVKTYQRYRTEDEVSEGAHVPPHPAAQVEVDDPKGRSVFTGWLGGEGWRREATVRLGDASARISYQGCGAEEPYSGGDDGQKLFVRVRGTGLPRVFPVEPWVPFTVCEGYSFRVTCATLDYGKRNEAVPPTRPVNPAVQVEITGPQGVEQRWAFAKYPDHGASHEGITYDGFQVQYSYPDDERTHRAQIYSVVSADGVRHEVSFPGTGKRQPLAVGEATPLTDNGYQMKLLRFSADAKVSLKESEGSDGRVTQAARLRICRDGKDDDVTVHAGETISLEGDHALLSYVHRSGDPTEVGGFTARLRLEEGEQAIETATVSMNNPLVYRGYTIHLAPYYSTAAHDWRACFQIVKDPGLRVQRAGFCLLALGLLCLWIARPQPQGARV